jgi:hypothetical protein
MYNWKLWLVSIYESKQAKILQISYEEEISSNAFDYTRS